MNFLEFYDNEVYNNRSEFYAKERILLCQDQEEDQEAAALAEARAEADLAADLAEAALAARITTITDLTVFLDQARFSAGIAVHITVAVALADCWEF